MSASKIRNRIFDAIYKLKNALSLPICIEEVAKYSSLLERLYNIKKKSFVNGEKLSVIFLLFLFIYYTYVKCVYMLHE